MTLACDNTSIKCHKMILSACSSYFQTLFMENTCEHPIVFLKDIKIGEVRAILDYMYKGEVNIAQEELPGLLKVAELLRVKGLVEGEGDKLLNANFGKNGRPPVSTALNEPPTSSSKLNGGDRDMPASFGSSGSSDRRSISENRNERENRERERDNNANSKSDMRPFPFSHAQAAGNMPMPMFPLPGMFPNLLGARDQVPPRMPGGSREEENDREGSPSPPGSGGKRRKVASGSGGSCSSKESGPLGHADQRAIALDLARERQERDSDKGLHANMDKDDGLMGLPPGLDKSGIANYVPSQRLEWKRYKQYTRNDIMSAIEEVKAGMSALQASRKYGVPSRTLYDKVKKMGITTGRQVQRKSLPDYPSQFPGLGRMMNVSDLEDRGDTNDSSEGAPGDVMEGRATMVPPTSLSTYMLNIMKGIREPDHSKDGEISLTALNLSTMLPSSAKNSLSPRSPRSSHPPSSQHRDLEIDDTVDSTGRHRHSSGSAGADNDADIKSQFLADLRRLGSHIPTQTGNGNSNSSEPVSTTHSPPAAPASSGSGPPSTPTKMEDGDLPPRKRKVSQEHVKDRESPYNGVVSSNMSQEDLKTENNEAIQASN